MKLLSIIIPSYNVEIYIKECLDSIVNQLTEEVELIIVDDFSTDKTKDIIKSYLLKYDFIFVENDKNLGPGASRNVALKYATGKYLTFIDSDDYVPDYYVSTILDSIKEDKDYYKMAWSEFGMFGDVFHKVKNPSVHRMMADTVVKRSLIKLPFKEEVFFGEDADFFRINIPSGSSYGTIDKPMYYYRRRRPGSLSYQHHAK